MVSSDSACSSGCGEGQLICDSRDIAASPAFPLPRLENRLHRAFPQLLLIFPLRRNEPAQY